MLLLMLKGEEHPHVFELAPDPWELILFDIIMVWCCYYREKKNIHMCLNPILTPEEERQSVPARQGALRVDQVLFRYKKFSFGKMGKG